MNLMRPARNALLGLVCLGPALGGCLGDGATTAKSQSDTTSSNPTEETSQVSAGLQANGSIVVVRRAR